MSMVHELMDVIQIDASLDASFKPSEEQDHGACKCAEHKEKKAKEKAEKEAQE